MNTKITTRMTSTHCTSTMARRFTTWTPTSTSTESAHECAHCHTSSLIIHTHGSRLKLNFFVPCHIHPHDTHGCLSLTPPTPLCTSQPSSCMSSSSPSSTSAMSSSRSSTIRSWKTCATPPTTPTTSFTSAHFPVMSFKTKLQARQVQVCTATTDSEEINFWIAWCLYEGFLDCLYSFSCSWATGFGVRC